MEDRRVLKSKEAIRQCFLALLKDKKLKQVTVSEICRMANIGRGTFYLHYLDVYDLYDQIEAELYQGLYQLFESCYPTSDAENCRRLADGLTGYVAENKEIFLLLNQAVDGHSLQKLCAVFYEKAILENKTMNPSANPDYETVEAIFAVSGMVGVLERWLSGGMRISREWVAEMLNHILCKINARG